MAIFTTTDGCRLYYDLHGFDGEKPVVVFLNGTTQTALQWRPQARFFKDEFRVVCYDGRAQGKSELGSRPLSLDLHVEDLAALFSYLKIDLPHLVGLSHGAQVALAFAARFPEKTDRMVLCGVGSEPEPRSRMIVRSWLEIIDRCGLEPMAWAALPVVLGEKYLAENQQISEKMVAALAVRNRRASLLAHFSALLRYPAPSVDAEATTSRCLVISGEDDLLVSAEEAKRLADLTAGEHIALEQVGHSVPIEAAEHFNRICHRFLTQP